MQGLNQELEVEDDMSVDELKNEIEARANVPKSNQVNTDSYNFIISKLFLKMNFSFFLIKSRDLFIWEEF